MSSSELVAAVALMGLGLILLLSLQRGSGKSRSTQLTIGAGLLLGSLGLILLGLYLNGYQYF